MNQLLKPCEERLQTVYGKKTIRISIPKENPDEETRLPLTPQGVEVLVAQGHTVVIEASAGERARFSDQQYSNAGAHITHSHADAFKADVVLKITPPTDDELQYIKDGQTFVSFITHHSRNAKTYKALAEKKCSIIALDFVSANNEESTTTRCLGELEGVLAITTAAKLLEYADGNGKGIIIGGVTGVPPTEIVILGSGTSAMRAAGSALAMGASVKIFGHNHVNLQHISQQFNHHVFTSILHPQALSKAMTSADVIIGTRTLPGQHQLVVSQETMKLMKRGAIAIDLNTTFGGRFETSEPTTLQQPTFTKFNIIHHCLPDMTALAPHTATIVLSDIITPMVTELSDNGGLHETIKHNHAIANGTIMLKGITTNQYIAKQYGVEYYDINLLIF